MATERRTSDEPIVPFLNAAVEQRWLGWQATQLGRSGVTIVEAEMDEWSGIIPPSIDTVVHVLLPGANPTCAVRDLGDGTNVTLVHAGQVCVTPAGQSGRWAWRGRFRDLNLVIPGSLLARTADDAGLSGLPDLMPIARKPQEDLLIERLIHRLGDVAGGKTQSFGSEMDHAVALVAYWLLRQAKPTLTPPRGSLSPSASRRVCAFIEENLGRDISVGDLAGLVGLSTPYFSHAFRGSIGEAPHQYILRRRCTRACERLEGTDMLAAIALDVGFASQAHFTTVFRRFMGTTPAAWRRARRL